MSDATLAGQDEARRALADRIGSHLDENRYGYVLDLDSDEWQLVIAALRTPSLDRGVEEMKEACLKAAASASYGPPSSWPGDFPRGWRHPPAWDEDRTPTPTEAAWHDNGARDAWFAIRVLPVPADLNEGEAK